LRDCARECVHVAGRAVVHDCDSGHGSNVGLAGVSPDSSEFPYVKAVPMS
jgi:hypothetical protein